MTIVVDAMAIAVSKDCSHAPSGPRISDSNEFENLGQHEDWLPGSYPAGQCLDGSNRGRDNRAWLTLHSLH